MFVSTDEIRPKFLKPWRERNHVYASECHILIRVNANMTNEEYREYHSDTDKLFPVDVPDGIITSEQLTDAIAKAPTEPEMSYEGTDVTCDECDGDGFVIWEYKHWQQEDVCPKCDGDGLMERRKKVPTGRQVMAEMASVRIGKSSFKAYFLNMLLNAMKFVGCDSVAVTLGSKDTPTRFNLTDGIDIILMPINIGNAFYTEIKPKILWY